jgi:SAM-dependent methyltransferase
MNDRVLYRAEGLPVLQNTTFATRDEAIASDRGSMRLVEDAETGLVHNAAFDPAKLIYDQNYQNEQSCSASFRQHLDQVSGIVDRHFAGKKLIEVGCGKGYFLERLRERGYAATGIDPAYEGTSPHVLKAAFEPSLGLSAEAVVLRHVLEHIDDPVSFLADICRSNGGQGLIYIEVPCFDWICRQRTWFDIFYEHINYFRLADFHRMFGRVLQSGRIFGDQYLYVVADLASLRVPRRSTKDQIEFPADFLATRDRYANLPARPRAIWGAASKGVIFAIHMQQLNTQIDFAIDINPVKQGRYLPASGLRVASPEEGLQRLPEGNDIFVMNSNYLEEIRALSGNQYTYIAIDHATD